MTGPARPEWLYGSGCCEQWTPGDGCRWHTGRPAMSLAARDLGSEPGPAAAPDDPAGRRVLIRIGRIFRSRTRARLADAEAMIGYLEASLDALERQLVQDIDALRTDFGDDLKVLRDDEVRPLRRRLDAKGSAS